MGFQGDVAGIGLGELLQGLARGGREGVLTLRSRGLGATIGVESGQLFLLPEPDEDPEVWRKRCERAWVKDPNHRIDILRMSEIAYATRLEGMFRLLDHEGGIHFKFEEGPLPRPTTPREHGIAESGDVPLARAETGMQIEVKVAVHCPGISVEFLLLEHARLADECSAHGDSTQLSIHEVPRTLQAEPPSPGAERLWEECDGMSNLIEIADRLGLPIRQVQGSIQDLVSGGQLRFADARELLVLAQNELKQNRFARAGSRLSGWIRTAPAGPPTEGDAHLLITEWNRGKLPVVLASMRARAARTLLRRLEAAEGDPAAAILRWQEMRKYHKHDPICEVRLVRWQLVSEDEADRPSTAELIRLARKFEEQGRTVRAAVLLRAAATLLPENPGARIELGVRMLAVDMIEEGAPWILEACRALIQADASDRAAGPLRSLLTADPSNREARALLGLARKKSASGRKARRNAIVGLAVMLALSLAALVRVQHEKDRERQLDEVAAHEDQPELALRMLEEHFTNDDAERVVAMREELIQRLMASELGVRDAWLEHYEQCSLECTAGDPLLGLERALEMPAPPRLRYLPAPDWPAVDELFDSLCARLEQTVAEWGDDDVDLNEALHAEQRLTTLIDDLMARVDGVETTHRIDNLTTRLSVLRTTLVERSARRAAERERLLTEQRLERQNMLLAAARLHAQAGDLERSVEAYHELIGMEGSETIAKVLADEVAEVEHHRDSVREARRLALESRHDEAREVLAEGCPDPSEHILPWRVESQPSGARVRLPDGWERTTPFTIESAFGEHLELVFELDGHEPYRLVVDAPRDRMLPMSRLPDRWWHDDSPITAVPVPSGADHICADRSGRVVRLAAEGPAWTTDLDSISGVARAPVGLPKRPGTFLVVSEEGKAWLIDAADGATEGPFALDAPPASGPRATATGVTAGFTDGTSAVWDTELQPTVSQVAAEAPDGSGAARDTHGSDAGLAVLRRSAERGTRLASPWTPWVIEVAEGSFTLSTTDGLSEPIHVSRSGDWNFVAWEAPTRLLPRGQVWISDGAGLRAVAP